MKKIYTLIALAISSASFAQYTGTGTFSKITNLNDLTDGYYVITNEEDEFLMTSDRSGTATGGFFIQATISFTANNIENPLPKDVWKVETTSNGKTIYNETISKYVGWSAGNTASIEDAASNSSTWTFSYSDNKFTVNNFNTPARQLSYNAQNPRFAVYGNSGQQELQFYKLTQTSVENPTLTVSTNTITGLNYTENEGPSTSQMFNISGENLNSSNVTITAPTNFEVSLDNSQFGSSATLTAFNGTQTPIYVRLGTNLEVDSYTGNISINGGGITTPITVATSGEVTAPVLLPELTASITSLTDLDYAENEGPSASQTFNISGVNLDDSDVTVTAPENFEVSSDNNVFDSSIDLVAFNGSQTAIYVRLASGLAIDTYSGNISISGGGTTTPITIAISGEVTETASVKENNIDGLKVYPNPAYDVVNISSNEIGTKDVIIFNMLGKKVLETSTNETINISNLNSGVYIMNITQDGKKATRKLVIK